MSVILLFYFGGVFLPPDTPRINGLEHDSHLLRDDNERLKEYNRELRDM